MGEGLWFTGIMIAMILAAMLSTVVFEKYRSKNGYKLKGTEFNRMIVMFGIISFLGLSLFVPVGSESIILPTVWAVIYYYFMREVWIRPRK